jgi:hypothetical protein
MTVDWLGLETNSGPIVLFLLDELEWDVDDEMEHIFLLQEKLNAYLAFIENGEVFDRLLDTVVAREVARDTPITVRILARCVPTEKAVTFLEFAKNVFEKAGFELTHEVVRPGHRYFRRNLADIDRKESDET